MELPLDGDGLLMLEKTVLEFLQQVLGLSKRLMVRHQWTGDGDRRSVDGHRGVDGHHSVMNRSKNLPDRELYP